VGHDLCRMFGFTFFRFLLLSFCIISSDFALRDGYLAPFAKVRKFFEKLFAATRQQEGVFVALFSEQLRILGANPLIVHVHYY